MSNQPTPYQRRLIAKIKAGNLRLELDEQANTIDKIGYFIAPDLSCSQNCTRDPWFALRDTGQLYEHVYTYTNKRSVKYIYYLSANEHEEDEQHAEWETDDE